MKKIFFLLFLSGIVSFGMKAQVNSSTKKIQQEPASANINASSNVSPTVVSGTKKPSEEKVNAEAKNNKEVIPPPPVQTATSLKKPD